MIRFVYPYLLLLLSLVPLIGVAWWWQMRRTLANLNSLIAPALQPRLLPSHSTSRTVAQIILTLAAFTLLVVAAARPQWGRRAETVITRGRNLLIALDVSRSMLAGDVHPNRLERAKADLLDLIVELKGDNAGLLAFRNKGALICPLTTDYSFLRQALDGVSPESAPRGATDLADGIRKSLEALEGMPDDHNAILMISDGEELSGDALAAARDAGKRGIPIFTVGIGDPAGATIPGDTTGEVFRFKGQVVQTRLMDATLSAIAHESGGAYIPLATAGTAHTTLGAIYRRHLRTVAARERQETLQNQYIERYHLFLIPAIIILAAAATLSRGRFAGRRRRATPPPPIPLVAAILAFAMLTIPSQASVQCSVSSVQHNTLKRSLLNVPLKRTSGGRCAINADSVQNNTLKRSLLNVPLKRILSLPFKSKRLSGTFKSDSPPHIPLASSLPPTSSTTTNATTYGAESRPATQVLRPAFTPGSGSGAATATNNTGHASGRAAAREGQALYRRGKYTEAAAAFTAAAAGADAETAAAWRYNAALAHLKAGENDEAAALLRNLTTVKSISAAAAEALGAAALAQSRAIKAEAGAVERTAQLEMSATALQTALRAAPADQRRLRNLSRVANDLPEARTNAHIEAVLKAHPQPQPDQLLETIFRQQRALLKDIPAAFTNEAPILIPTAEALAQRQSEATDLLIPLKQVLLESGAITNDQQRGTTAMMIESARDNLAASARKLRDLDATAMHDAARVEPFAYALWKDVAMPPPLLNEDITLQSNALTRAVSDPQLYQPQPEALDLTRRFRARFPAWADQVQQQAQADTNAPTLTPEARAEIEQLAEETVGLQQEADRSPAPADYQQRALANLLRIRELLPKQPQSGQAGQPPPQQQEQPQEQEQQPDDQQQQQEQEQKPEQEQQKPETPKDVQEMLRRALEREKEHEDQKREAMRNIPLSPSEQDW